MERNWRFPSSNGGLKEGLNNSGIETFRDNPIKSLAREICQNSLDAALNDNPVMVEFKTFNIKRSEFPDLQGFCDILTKCHEKSKEKSNSVTIDFFANALKKINKDSIPMLRISDFNTTGLNDQDWDNLVDSSGVSDKSEGQGGSFGIGKNAPFACSDFRTVFYSTLDKENNTKSKGVSRLIAHKLGTNPDGSDDLSQGTGFYGIATDYNIKYINAMLNLDKSFNRTTSGTDIFVSGLMVDMNFSSTIIAEVIDSFLVAIWNEKLEVKVNDFLICKQSLPTVCERFSKFLNANTIMCFDLLSDTQTQWFDLPIALQTLQIGNIKFGFKLRQDGTNKVSMVRSTGMKILDKTGLCPSLRFVGLAIVEGSLNTILRKLENPSHTKWEVQRAPDPSYARTILKTMYNAISDKLNEFAINTFDKELDIEGAGEYLPDEIIDLGSKQQQEGKKENLNKLISIEAKVIENPKSNSLETDEIGNDILSSEDAQGSPSDEGVLDGYDRYGKKPLGSGDRDFDEIGNLDDDSEYGKAPIVVKAKEIRIFCIDKKEQWYRLVCTPLISSFKGIVTIYKLAEQNEKMPIIIKAVNNPELEFKKNKIFYFSFSEGKPFKVDFRISGHEYSTMEVKLYAYKG